MASTDYQQEKGSSHSTELSLHPRTRAASPERTPDYNGMNNSTTTATTADNYPHGLRLTAIVTTIVLATFLVALDNVSQAIPSAS